MLSGFDFYRKLAKGPGVGRGIKKNVKKIDLKKIDFCKKKS